MNFQRNSQFVTVGAIRNVACFGLVLSLIACSENHSQVKQVRTASPDDAIIANQMLYGNRATILVLRKVILPHVDLKGMTLGEACDFIESRVRDYLQQVEEVPTYIAFVVADEVKMTRLRFEADDIFVSDLLDKLKVDYDIDISIRGGIVIVGSKLAK